VVPEASLERAEHGLRPISEGWFVVNARDTRWFDGTPLGRFGIFDSQDARFDQLGVGMGILRPGEPNCMYHAEEMQEDFLVLSGECLLIVEGEERPLKQWDFVHCPPWTPHVFVGSGEGPCVVLGFGARKKGRGILYPVDETALKHGAGVEEETSDPDVAYAKYGEGTAIPCPEELPDL
jgi:uncharacterized cupin superfamily protein